MLVLLPVVGEENNEIERDVMKLKKLSLSRETLVVFGDNEASQVAGGVLYCGPSDTDACPGTTAFVTVCNKKACATVTIVND